MSQVEGQLQDDASAIDVFRATFPAGTMTGAPKVRAMQIIDELEPERRGPYAGAIGYIAAGDRRMDLAITIRTCVIADGVASVQAGAGIVADSVPANEWEETENKARAMLTAIGQVREALERARQAPRRAARRAPHIALDAFSDRRHQRFHVVRAARGLDAAGGARGEQRHPDLRPDDLAPPREAQSRRRGRARHATSARATAPS